MWFALQDSPIGTLPRGVTRLATLLRIWNTPLTSYPGERLRGKRQWHAHLIFVIILRLDGRDFSTQPPRAGGAELSKWRK